MKARRAAAAAAPVVEAPVSRLAGRGLLKALWRGEAAAILARGVFPEASMAELARRLEDRGGAFPESSFPPEFRARFLGRCLDLAGPDLGPYFDAAEGFERALAGAFEGLGDFWAETARLFAALSGTDRVEVPGGPGGRRYASATIRWMEEGGHIPPHCEAEQSQRPPYADLRGRITPEAMASYYLMVQPPERGGELCVSTLRWSDLGPERVVDGRSDARDLVEARPHQRLAPRAGDVVVIDGGARFHWVSPCGGRRLRWTLGGFASPARDGRRLFVWS